MKILCTSALEGVFHAILPDLPGDSVRFGTTGGLVAEIEAGTGADLVFAARPALEELGRLGKVEMGSLTDVARTDVSVAIKQGAGKIDLSSEEALRKLLLAAGPIAYSDPAGGGGSGTHFAKVLDRLGITEQINHHAILVKAGGNSGDYVGTGQAALAVQMTSELILAKGIEIAGPLPGDFAKTITFAGALVSGAKHTREALDIMQALKTPAAGEILRAAGLDQA